MQTRGTDLNFYDIYGYVIAVENSGDSVFNKEYSRFKIKPKRTLKPNLLIREEPLASTYPTKPLGDDKGVLLPFHGENTLLYNTGTNNRFILSVTEAFINIDMHNKCFLHAGAVCKKENAILLPAGSNVGKTSTVLQLLNMGYDYLSDDWIIIGNGKAYPFPKLLHIFDYNLVNNKAIAKRVLGRKYMLFPFYEFVFNLRKILIDAMPFRRIKHVLDIIRPVYYMDVEDLCPNWRVGGTCEISNIFYLELYEGDSIVEEEMGAKELSEKMAVRNLIENNSFLLEYHKYAFRGLDDKRVENWIEHDKEIMFNTFANRSIKKLLIPRNNRNNELYKKIAKLIDLEVS